MSHGGLLYTIPYPVIIPRNCTVDVPLPPDRVVTIISPRPFPGPDLAIILFEDFHSADSKQSHPHTVKPRRSLGPVPKNSPLTVTRVPGGPSFGDTPVTTGGGPISQALTCYFTKFVCRV